MKPYEINVFVSSVLHINFMLHVPQEQTCVYTHYLYANPINFFLQKSVGNECWTMEPAAHNTTGTHWLVDTETWTDSPHATGGGWSELCAATKWGPSGNSNVIAQYGHYSMTISKYTCHLRRWIHRTFVHCKRWWLIIMPSLLGMIRGFWRVFRLFLFLKCPGILYKFVLCIWHMVFPAGFTFK